MGQALYRTYRSKSLDEVIGQEHITTTLKNALKSGKISHAYLFTGPRGVGKTSIARILAHEVNNIPYTDESIHLDIIEIDAASNRRIDEIRDLRDKVHIAPTSGKYKVYIIDEVHMLTKEAFNALLKTLEEPPEHVIFILATTESHKLPETIISRTQRFTFKPIESKKVVSHLKSIAKQENISIDDKALELIAEHGEGSFRDSISLLDQARSINNDKVTLESVRLALGIAPDSAIEKIIDSLRDHDSKQLLDTIDELFSQGYQPAQLAKQISARIRESITNNSSVLNTTQTLKLLKELIDVPSSQNPARLIELVLLSPIIETPIVELEPPKSKPNSKDYISKQPAEPAIKEKIKINEAKPLNDNSSTKINELTIDVWNNTLDVVKKRYSTLYSFLRMANPNISANKISLVFEFPFHQKRVNEEKNIRILRDIISEFTKADFEVLTATDTTMKSSVKKAPEAKPKPNIETISNIFGGGEMLES